MREHGVRHLLMGGQACILYGAAEFSRDTDLAILASRDNLERLRAALASLDAHVVAVPPFQLEYLERGHAVHFECGVATTAAGMRVDVMSKMRNVPTFEICWSRRSTFDLPELGSIDVLGLEDLVDCKKTRRDKDWPMIRRLVERHYLDSTIAPTVERFRFWLGQLRTPLLLVECVERARIAGAGIGEVLEEQIAAREATALAAEGESETAIANAMVREEARERVADEAYWRPLIKELEELRHSLRHRRK